MRKNNNQKSESIEEIKGRIKSNDEDDAEICCFEFLARNIHLQEELCEWIKQQNTAGMKSALVFGILGAINIFVAIIMIGIGKGTMSIVICVFAAVLFELLSGLTLWLYRIPLSNLELYFVALQENAHFWTMIGLITKTKNVEKNIDKELYASMIESEMRKREQLLFSKRKE